jgi:hypothetical protein
VTFARRDPVAGENAAMSARCSANAGSAGTPRCPPVKGRCAVGGLPWSLVPKDLEVVESDDRQALGHDDARAWIW